MNNIEITGQSSGLPALPTEEAFERAWQPIRKAWATVFLASINGDLRDKSLRDPLATLETFIESKSDRALAYLAKSSRPATRREISEHIAMLLVCLPGAKDDAEEFAKALTLDVASQHPSIGALEAACRRLRRTLHFRPKIVEMLEALAEAEQRISYARKTIEELPALIDKAKTALTDAEQARQETERRRETARPEIRRRLDAGEPTIGFPRDLIEAIQNEILVEKAQSKT